jgi:hypothetical protein
MFRYGWYGWRSILVLAHPPISTPWGFPLALWPPLPSGDGSISLCRVRPASVRPGPLCMAASTAGGAGAQTGAPAPRRDSLQTQLLSGITSFVLCLSGRERDKLLLVQLGENKPPVTSTRECPTAQVFHLRNTLCPRRWLFS